MTDDEADDYLAALIGVLEVIAGGRPQVHDLIACTTCRARVDESCKTKTGHTTSPHDGRLTPRLCPCGASLDHQRRYCDRCRDRIHAANTYAGVVRWRATYARTLTSTTEPREDARAGAALPQR